MRYDLYTLDSATLKTALKTLIEAERDLTKSRHIALTRMINELSVTGSPLLTEAARALLDEDRAQSQTWMSAPLRSALERACSGVEGAPPELERRFDTSEEEHLLDQLRALLIDLEQLVMVSDKDEMSQLRTLLWISATRHLLARVDEERDQHVRLCLIYASDELGDLALAPELFEQRASEVLAERLRLCHAGGGELSLISPGESDEAQIAQLKESGLALDLRGVERLKLEGYGVLDWLDGVEQGLDTVQTIEAMMLSDDDVVGLRSRGLFERVEAGWSTPVVVDEVAGVEFAMVRCPAGEFWMGSDEEFGWRSQDQHQPRYRVEITKPFLIGQTQVTQAQWSAIMGSAPSHFEGANLPVEQVNWFDCVRFCNALSELAGLEPVYDIGSGDEPTVSLELGRTGYRLPTEAEWEYMAKAGTELTYAGSNDVDEVACYGKDWSDGSTEDVAQKKPNAWGIYDCSGNVDEWCSDKWNDSAYQGRTSPTRDPHEWVGSAAPRVDRGGSWSYGADGCRVACRNRFDADGRGDDLGFRLLRC